MSPTRGLLADVVPASCVDGPGNRFVVFTQGCSFNCLACHNPHTIGQTGGTWVDVDEVVAQVRDAAPFISGVTVSGGEATCQWEFVQELFTALRHDPELSHLSTMVDTNGDASADVWDALAPWMDGAMVDLKALDPAVHQMLTGRPNTMVLASIEHLASIDRLYEVRLLLIPGVNDDDETLRRTVRWLEDAAPGVPVRLNAFRHDGTRAVARQWNEASADVMERATRTLTEVGVRVRTAPTPPP